MKRRIKKGESPPIGAVTEVIAFSSYECRITGLATEFTKREDQHFVFLKLRKCKDLSYIGNY
jgi:hypothetical protein